MCCRSGLRVAVHHLVTLAILVFVACSSDDRGPTKPTSAGDPPDTDWLPVSAVTILDSLPTVSFELSEIRLPNDLSAQQFLDEIGHSRSTAIFPLDTSMGPQDSRNELILRLIQRAQYLTNKNNFNFPAEGPNRPAQSGLAYVYGGKRVDQRTKPSYECCQEELYGLDCSGFIYQVFLGAGVTLDPGPAWLQAQSGILTAKIREQGEYGKLFAEALGRLGIEELETGDLIYWTYNDGSNAAHIGIVLESTSGGLAIYQSNGSIGTSNGYCSQGQCEKNRGPGRGPRTIPLNAAPDYFLGADGEGPRYAGVIRIQAEISGRWEFFLRCEGRYDPAVTVSLDFPTTENNAFRIARSFHDYDGNPLDGVFNFSYDQVSNTLTCTYALTSENCATNPFRVERIATPLYRDDTGYVPAQVIDWSECAECPAECRLLNRER